MHIATEQENNIPGWGIDADPANEPTYPIKHYTGDDHNRLDYDRPPQQQSNTEVLMSIERPALPAVYGTTLPPTGLSGMLRRYAFRHSENSFKHWLPLLLADRVNVWEGVAQDLSRGHLPNVFAESGWGAIYRHDKKLFARKTAIVTVVTATVLVLLFRKRLRKLF